MFADTSFVKTDWHPTSLKICQPGEWKSQRIQKTVLPMLTLVCHHKKVMHRGWVYFESRLANTFAIFNVLVFWDGFQVDKEDCVHFSINQFSL